MTDNPEDQQQKTGAGEVIVEVQGHDVMNEYVEGLVQGEEHGNIQGT